MATKITTIRAPARVPFWWRWWTDYSRKSTVPSRETTRRFDEFQIWNDDASRLENYAVWLALLLPQVPKSSSPFCVRGLLTYTRRARSEKRDTSTSHALTLTHRARRNSNMLPDGFSSAATWKTDMLCSLIQPQIYLYMEYRGILLRRLLVVCSVCTQYLSLSLVLLLTPLSSCSHILDSHIHTFVCTPLNTHTIPPHSPSYFYMIIPYEWKRETFTTIITHRNGEGYPYTEASIPFHIYSFLPLSHTTILKYTENKPDPSSYLSLIPN